MNGPQEPPSTLGVHPARVAREEPEKIKKWREEQQKRLEEKGNVSFLPFTTFL